MAARKAVLTQLIQDAVLKLCTQNVEFDESLEIDGIICITHSQIAPEIVVKMHRTIMKPEEPPVQSDPSLQWTEQQQQQYTEPMSQAAKGSIAGRSGGAYATAESFDPSGGTQFIGGMNQVQGYVADSQETYQSDSTSKDSNYGTPKSQRKRKKQPEVQAQAESITKQIKVEDTDDAIYIEDTGSEPPGGSMDQQQGSSWMDEIQQQSYPDNYGNHYHKWQSQNNKRT
ncbi:unnamed protein product [Owenia fusiformis]|uniref:Uncharacterized protein n=1 Tax=Owenia fusiformis TaxID=6347 RepID=A0A8J1TFM1_OWEFU|nr:unnamed protein product [Owenia fusiformis]